MIELPAIEISLAEIADHLGLEASSSVVEAELIVVFSYWRLHHCQSH